MVLEFLGSEFLGAWSALHLLLANAQLAYAHESSGNIPDDTAEMAKRVLPAIESECNRLELKVGAALAQAANEQFQTERNAFVLEAYLLNIRKAIVTELQERKFARVAVARSVWFQRNDAFGEKVATAFPLATEDIKAAGNCYALGLGTAAVFHLMRVAEHGLRHIANALRISAIGKNNRPIEFENWNTICTAIEKKVEVLQNKKPSQSRAKQLSHFNEMSLHIRAFKDCWRNDVSHTRRLYEDGEAGTVLWHVRGFMRRLAEGPA